MNIIPILLKVLGFLPTIINIVMEIWNLIKQIQDPTEKAAMQMKANNIILHAKLGKQALPLINSLSSFAKELSEKVQKG